MNKGILFSSGLVLGVALGLLGVMGLQSTASTLGLSESTSPAAVNSAYPEAKTMAEVRLFAASEATCGAITEIGMRVTADDGSSEITVNLADADAEPEYAVARFSKLGDLVRDSARLFSDGVPVPCMAASLHQQIERKANPAALAFIVDELGVSAETGGIEQFVLHMHRGSAEISNTYFSIQGGHVVGYSDSAASNLFAADGSISFDVDPVERAAVRSAIYPNN